MRIGIDAGGTFTDFVVLHDDGRLEWFKLRSNPAAPDRVILAGLARAAAPPQAEVVHGSTVATNALLERKGARTAFVTTAGFEDLLEIGRQNRARLYDLTPPPKRLLVQPELCFGVAERVYADGTVAKTPSAREIAQLRRKLQAARVESVAVCFLHSYHTPQNEALIRDALAGLFPLSVSHEVCAEFREYERAATTALNAYVGPLMQAYLGALKTAPQRISILQSNGGSISLDEASRQAVRTILSGPAGGAVAVAAAGAASGFRRVLGFDMGGTSTDVCLCDGAPRETVEAYVDELPIRVPMLEIHTVGAGGGSIARVDAGGLLRAGPESAGSNPGPACYGVGELPTVTDAHVVLGRIGADQFLGGEMHLDVERASAAVGRLASQLGLTTKAAAEGVVRIANSNIDRAIRVVSVERGYDPRDFALVAFGGCGGLHACDVAEGLGIRTVLVPRFAGALSALGMLLADTVRDYSQGVLNRSDYASVFQTLEGQACADLPGARTERYADIRYQGQSYEITVPWNATDAARPFHAAHQRTYGYRHEGRAIEIVTLRVRARLRRRKPKLRLDSRLPQGKAGARRVTIGGRTAEIPTLVREAVRTRAQRGPALILDYGSTTLVPPGWRYRMNDVGALVLEKI